ncbi:hypothetical protein HAX54_031169 [Datura stramonium]|uniref:Disease resistance protein At4g27190-like leucine-rich repeats domain-containing protein n=1 Tax=Datura stramonium TaxID=4076 RepID=A0ABS8SBR5_DATST|nr:hypothetical protein [Datura stramonium]
MDLKVIKSTPLGDWIRQLLRKSELVHSSGNGSKNVLTELLVEGFQNVKDLRLAVCDSSTHSLMTLLWALSSLSYKMCFYELPEFQNFWPRVNNSISDSSPLFDEKVSCPILEELCISRADSISALFSQQLPTGFFNKLKELEVWKCEKLRNLMSPSVARGVLNLRILKIGASPSMEQVITEEEQQGEEMTNEPLFSRLEELVLYEPPKLRHFFLDEPCF